MTHLPDITEPRRKKKIWKDLLRVALVAAFFIAAGVLLNHRVVEDDFFDIDVLREHLQQQGLAGVLRFVGVAALINILGIPRLWICAAAGSLFGAVEGIVIGMVTTLIGASVNFLMGRSLLRGPLRRHMPERLQRWYKLFNLHGFRAILYMRLFPGANATLTSMMGGASRMRFRDYLLATFIGFIPFTVVFATLGSSAAKQSEWQLVAGLVLFAVVALVQLLYSRWRGRLPVPAGEIVGHADMSADNGKALK